MKHRIRVRAHPRRVGRKKVIVRRHTKRIRASRSKGPSVWYGPNIVKLKKTGITLDDVVNTIRSDKELYEKTKKLKAVVIEQYPSPKEFGKKFRSEAYLSIFSAKHKPVGKYKPVLVLQAFPSGDSTIEKHRAKIPEELRHELKHLEQLEKGTLKFPKEGKKIVIDPKSEKEALKSMRE